MTSICSGFTSMCRSTSGNMPWPTLPKPNMTMRPP
jgi:hypothetical protein